MLARIVAGIAVFFTLVVVFACPSYAASPKLGFAVSVEGEGFFFNPLVTRILVTEVKKASLAEAAGIRAGDIIIRIQGQSVVGRRARELRPLMDFNPGETRTLRLQRSDGTEYDARFTNPKG